MGLLSVPTMLRRGYQKELATGTVSASGTLGQIIPPSIVIVLLGTLAGDLYSAAQEDRARLAGCSDALTYLGEPAVVSVGTLFQAALLPGILLALVLLGLGLFVVQARAAEPESLLERGRYLMGETLREIHKTAFVKAEGKLTSGDAHIAINMEITIKPTIIPMIRITAGSIKLIAFFIKPLTFFS